MTNIVELTYSKDGGHNQTPWKQRSLGERGQFLKRTEWLQLGMAKEEWIFEVRVTSPCKRDLMSASWLPEATNR